MKTKKAGTKKTKKWLVPIILLGIAVVLAISVMVIRASSRALELDLTENMTVFSAGIPEGGIIPDRYTGYGDDVSPDFRFQSEFDPKAKSIAIILDDLDHPLGTYTHWVIWNLPIMPMIFDKIPEGAVLDVYDGAVQGVAYGRHKYRGPKPPFGWTHRYQYKIYVLDTMLDLSESSGKRQLLAAMDGHVVQYDSIIASYM